MSCEWRPVRDSNPTIPYEVDSIILVFEGESLIKVDSYVAIMCHSVSYLRHI